MYPQDRCENCRFWVMTNEVNLPKGFRKCELVRSEDGSAEYPTALAFALDGESYVANMLTHANFHCIQWLPSEMDPAPEDWSTFHHPTCGKDYRGCHPRCCPKDQYEKTGRWQPELAEREV